MQIDLREYENGIIIWISSQRKKFYLWNPLIAWYQKFFVWLSIQTLMPFSCSLRSLCRHSKFKNTCPRFFPPRGWGVLHASISVDMYVHGLLHNKYIKYVPRIMRDLEWVCTLYRTKIRISNSRWNVQQSKRRIQSIATKRCRKTRWKVSICTRET